MIGKVIKYNLKNINTDLIIPARYLIKSDDIYLAQHCMEDLDRDFVEKVKTENYQILVADSNFGCGSSREQAPSAIKASGITCLIAPSFARIFFRNAINIGLPIIEFPSIGKLKTDDILNIHFEEGLMKNISTAEEFQVKKQPSFLQQIISAKGLINFARKQIE
ncbi:MAG: 3-isopropylmalate dehydratase small subunit [Candidatus Lokiarchaeota archaeon]|nr:3-isopropylmalate dehydratase small subunit [Candidatus Lokiarchaeota archaeon]